MPRFWEYPSKRPLDLAVAVIALLLLAPVLLAIAAIVGGAMGRPVLFVQTRPGLHGRPFRLYKFRTMRDARDPTGTPLSDAERLTRLGRWLRRSSLDELPELINVVLGDMSLVGPRPLLMAYLPLYNERQARRHEVRPGLTGWAQVNGRNAISWEEKLEFDAWYVDHQTLGLDLRILALTVKYVLSGAGISQPGFATAEAFKGSAPVRHTDGNGPRDSLPEGTANDP